MFLVSSVIFCPYLSFLSGVKGKTIVLGPWVLSLVSRVACPSTYLCFLNVFILGAVAGFSNTNGVPMAVSVRLFISVFLSVVRVCLPRSPLLAVLCSEFFAEVCVFLLSSRPRSPSLAVLQVSWALSWLCLSVGVSLLTAPLGCLVGYTVVSLLEIGLSECGSNNQECVLIIIIIIIIIYNNNTLLNSSQIEN